jgi:alpha/beta superfamily hydrolase
MPDTSHFFHRRLIDLRGAIRNGVRRNLPGVVEHPPR